MTEIENLRFLYTLKHLNTLHILRNTYSCSLNALFENLKALSLKKCVNLFVGTKTFLFYKKGSKGLVYELR